MPTVASASQQLQPLAALLRAAEERLSAATPAEVASAEDVLERLERLCASRRRSLRRTGGDGEHAPSAAPASSATSGKGASSAADAPPIPEGLVVGEPCLAMGLHAGQRRQFKALFMGIRPMKPEFLVKYVADVDGRTMPLLLPEVRNTYVPVHDLAPWRASAPLPPTSAKTRGQQADRQADEKRAAGERKRKQRGGGDADAHSGGTNGRLGDGFAHDGGGRGSGGGGREGRGGRAAAAVKATVRGGCVGKGGGEGGGGDSGGGGGSGGGVWREVGGIPSAFAPSRMGAMLSRSAAEANEGGTASRGCLRRCSHCEAWLLLQRLLLQQLLGRRHPRDCHVRCRRNLRR